MFSSFPTNGNYGRIDQVKIKKPGDPLAPEEVDASIADMDKANSMKRAQQSSADLGLPAPRYDVGRQSTILTSGFGLLDDDQNNPDGVKRKRILGF